jgi:RNA polymerase sigma factor (sigma-70 family)
VQPFEKLVTDHGAMVLRVCRATVGPVDAEDAWSETFLSALQGYPALPPDADVVGWLVTIAHRRSVDLLRRRGRSAVPLDPLPEPRGPARADADDEAALYDALRGLTERQRLSVAYHHLAGLPYREVAALVGGTEAAARRAAADGVRALRAALGATHHEEVGA